MRVYKVFTHDLRSPIVGGEPVWSGKLPYQLPSVSVARVDVTCGDGWAACRSPVSAAHWAGLLPDGKPARIFSCYVEGDVAEVKDDLMKGHTKLRCQSLLIDSEIPIEAVAEELCVTTFGKYANTMLHQLLDWLYALRRPLHSENIVGYSAYEALKQQGFGHMQVGPLSAIPEVDRINARIAQVTRQTQVDVRIQEGNNTGQRETFQLRNDRLNPERELAWLEPNTVWSSSKQAGAWSAKAALSHYYKNITSNPHKLTYGIIDAYRWGMQELFAHDKDTAVFTMEETPFGKLKITQPLSGSEDSQRP